MAMTNNQVFNFAGSNLELCGLLGIERQEGQPDHWHNYAIRPLKQRAGIEVAKGMGGEVFELKSRQRKSTVPANPAAAIVQLPQGLMALLPALHLMLQSKGHDLDGGIKKWILEESTPACPENGGEAILPDEVSEFLGLFGMDTCDNETMLLSYAGVKTLRAIRVDRIKDAIKVLGATNLELLSDEKLETLERLILSFALTGDSDAE